MVGLRRLMGLTGCDGLPFCRFKERQRHKLCFIDGMNGFCVDIDIDRNIQDGVNA